MQVVAGSCAPSQTRKRRALVFAAVCVVLVSAIIVLLASSSGGEGRVGRASPTALVEDGKSAPAAPEAAHDSSLGAEEVPADAPDARWSQPPFLGRLELTGIVESETGEPVSGAEVSCAPDGFEIIVCLRAAHLRTRTDSSGVFRMRGVPEARQYELRAWLDGAWGYQVLKERKAGARVTLRTLRYEMYSLVDKAGVPIDVQGFRNIGKVGDGWIYRTDYAYGLEVPLVLRRLGVELPARSNCVAIFWSRLVSPERAPTEITFRVPSFCHATVPRTILPLSEWPKATPVELDETPLDSGSAPYIVELPQLEPPARWVEEGGHVPSMRVMVRVPGTTHSWTLETDWRRFVGPLGTRFAIRMMCDAEDHQIDYSEETVERGVIRLRPKYPPLGYLSVLWDVAEAERRGGFVVMPKHRPDLGGPQMWPGYVRLGPFPVGRLKLVRWWYDNPKIESTDMMEVDVVEGHSEVHWK